MGLDRIAFITSNLKSVYELPLYRNIIGNFESEMGGNVGSALVEDKLCRIIELSKTLIMIFNDGYDLDNSPQGKAMKSFLAKISSEIDFLKIDISRFCKLLFVELRKHFAERSYFLQDSSIEKLENNLVQKKLLAVS